MFNAPWYTKSEYVHLWVHLVMKANHEPNEWLYKDKSFKVNRGQFVTSRKSLAKETGINPSKVERILKTFKIEQQIEQQNLFTSRLITILNYNVYQKSEQQTEQPVNSKRTASEQQVNTNKEDKKVKKDNKEREKKKRFSPPTVQEVAKYISEKNYSVDAQNFIDFYTSKNWYVGKNKMKDWKASVRLWESRNKKENYYDESKPAV